MIVLDTDVCIELLKGKEKVIKVRESIDDDIGISFMSIAELYYGAEKSKNPIKNYNEIEKLLLSMEIIHSDFRILKRFGKIKALLQKQGITLADADIFVAATTMETGTKLITGNVRHFERIPGLVIENWF
jgi:tRNA(fMet)-specific endonuclease VapC